MSDEETVQKPASDEQRNCEVCQNRKWFGCPLDWRKQKECFCNGYKYFNKEIKEK